MIHKYLRAIGFSKIKNRKELNKILNDVLKGPVERQYVSAGDERVLAEFRKEYADSIGVTVCGNYSEELEFEYDYYFPYIIGKSISSTEDVSIERHIEKESYAGMCDDLKVGVSLIFYLQNRMDYLKQVNMGSRQGVFASVSLAGLSTEGSIVLPLMKDPVKTLVGKKNEHSRHELLAAAREGNEEAIENLTIEDMDIYTAISKRIGKDDILSLVDTYFMPWGIECDLYSILGEILESRALTNSLTKEQIRLSNAAA